ncbi:hypothetical protein [Streptomyces nigrescens]|uniref:hypothetical protein n=1 Tax=Streptomyces nigrescens TaxID=1920 RepID=UPI0036FCFE06
MTTRSFIARPDGVGYRGIYVHYDGQPSHHLPLLLAAYQGRFNRDVEAMTHHLVDDVAIGWEEIGTDLLYGAPPAVVAALTGGEKWPSRTLDNLMTLDGSPVERMTVTADTVGQQDLQWGYVLHPHGIEVINLRCEVDGPVVSWDTDPRTEFADSPEYWVPNGSVPVTALPPAPLRSSTPPVTALPQASPYHPAARR